MVVVEHVVVVEPEGVVVVVVVVVEPEVVVVEPAVHRPPAERSTGSQARGALGATSRPVPATGLLLATSRSWAAALWTLIDFAMDVRT